MFGFRAERAILECMLAVRNGAGAAARAEVVADHVEAVRPAGNRHEFIAALTEVRHRSDVVNFNFTDGMHFLPTGRRDTGGRERRDRGSQAPMPSGYRRQWRRNPTAHRRPHRGVRRRRRSRRHARRYLRRHAGRSGIAERLITRGPRQGRRDPRRLTTSASCPGRSCCARFTRRRLGLNQFTSYPEKGWITSASPVGS